MSTDTQTQEFIDHIKIVDNPKYQILQSERKLLFQNFPKALERMMYGGILFSLSEDFSGVFVYANHVSFEFSYGYKLEDPNKFLEGKGKYRRHLKFKSMEDIKIKKLDFFLKQVKQFEN